MTHDDAHAEFHAKSAAMMERTLLEDLRVLAAEHWDWKAGQVLHRRLLDILAAHNQGPSEPVERCPRCGHMPHDSLGFCPNMASDNDCDCTTPAPERDTEPSAGLTDRFTITDAVARGVECYHGVALTCLSMCCGSNCGGTFDRMHPCPSCLRADLLAARTQATPTDVAEGGLAEAERLVAELDRAHRMSCSDPDDPTRQTLYSRARDILAARTQAPTDASESVLDLVREFADVHGLTVARDDPPTDDPEPGIECVAVEPLTEFLIERGAALGIPSECITTDVAEGGLVERLRALTAEYDAMGNTHAPGRDVADELRALLASVRPPIDVAGLCHWTQNRDNVQHHQTHDEFHFGNTCPYVAVAAILRGEPDPREPLAGGGS